MQAAGSMRACMHSDSAHALCTYACSFPAQKVFIYLLAAREYMMNPNNSGEVPKASYYGEKDYTKGIKAAMKDEILFKKSSYSELDSSDGTYNKYYVFSFFRSKSPK